MSTHPTTDERGRTGLAATLVAIGLAGAAIDNNGPVGLVLFVVGALAALYLLGRAAMRRVPPLPRPSRAPSWRLPAAFAITGSSSLLLAGLFKDQDPGLGGIVNQMAFAGIIVSAVLLASTLVVTTARVAGRRGA
jgi:hypothetical protein